MSASPDQNPVIRPGQSETQIVTGEGENPVQPGITNKGQILVPEAPGHPRQKRVHGGAFQLPAFQGIVSCR
jgi:hypothetical protein